MNSGRSENLENRSRCAIVSLRIPGPDWVDVTESSVAAYADRMGWEVVVLRERKIKRTLRWWRRRKQNLLLEKFQLYDVLNDFDRVVFVDADVMIHPEAPNILDEVPSGALGVLNEQFGVEEPKRIEEWTLMQERLGCLDTFPSRYFNSGVMVLARHHRELFDYQKLKFAIGRWPEQNTLNYYTVRKMVPICWLDSRWNHIPLFPDFWNAELRRRSWFVHYASEPAKQMMRSDLSFFGFNQG